MPDDEAPKIQIDSDWKAQAQAEKEKLAEQTKAAPAESGDTGGGTEAGAAATDAGQLPEASFETLMSTFVTQALYGLGAFPDPRTGQRVAHLDLARHSIDLLGVLEEKTKGNLTEQEADTLASTIYELRNQYVQVAHTARASGVGSAG